MIDKVIKCGGHCYDSYGWRKCPFWEQFETPTINKCMLFGNGVLKDRSKSLMLCDKIYGRDYEGDV